jgi:hypothetical protein
VNPIQRKLVEAGYLPVFDAAQGMVGETRLMFGTNDVCMTAFITPGENTRIYGKTRERTRQLIEDILPDAANALARLTEGPLSPERFLILVIHLGSVYTLDWPCEKATTGVLN